MIDSKETSINGFCENLHGLCTAKENPASTFQFGKYRVALQLIGDPLVQTFFTKAIAHLEEYHAYSDLTVWIIDYKTSGLMLPPPAWNWDEMDGFGNITTFPSDRYYANFQMVSGTFTLLDRTKNQAFIWLNDVTLLPEWERSFPLRPVLFEWLKNSDYLFLHSGAVGTSEGGVLLTGRGGSGKSTSTMACLDSTLRYAGDDFVIVDTVSLRVFSLYNVAKLEWAQLDMFPDLRPMVYNTNAGPDDKAQIFLWDYFPEKIIRAFPLKYILLPKFTGKTDTTIRKATEAEVLRALAPSTLALLKAAPEYLSKIRGLTAQISCLWIETGTDLKQIPLAIAHCLTQNLNIQEVEK